MKTILTILFSTLFITRSYSQNSKGEYKKTKVTLSTGQELKAKHLRIEKDMAFFQFRTSSGSSINLSYKMADLKKIQLAPNHSTATGFLIGTGIGIITMLIVEKRIEEPNIQTIYSSNFYSPLVLASR